MQVNLGRGFEATKEAIREAENKGISILLIQEPYIGNKGYLSSNHRVIQNPHSNTTNPVKSAAIILDQQLIVTENTRLHTANIIGFKIILNNLSVAFIGVYLEGETSIDPYLNHIEMVAESLQEANLIVAGDVNAKSVWWGCKEEDERGTAFVQLATQIDLNILNRGNTPTFYTYRGNKLYSSIVDVTACSSQLLNKIQNWRVNEDSAILTDHRQIEFTVTIGQEVEYLPNTSTWKYNTKKANWQVFQNTMRKTLEDKNLNPNTISLITDPKQLEDNISLYTQVIQQTCEETIAKIKESNKTKQGKSKWWNDKLTNTKRDLIRLRRKIKQANQIRRTVLIEKLKELKKQYKEMIDKSIAESWKEYCTNQDRETMWQKIGRVIRNSSKKEGDKLLRSPNDPNTTLDPTNSAELFAKTFYPPDDPAMDSPDQASIRNRTNMSTSGNQQVEMTKLTKLEIEMVFSKMNPRKAPGTDGLTSDICEAAYRADPETLLALLNKCLTTGTFPKIWKTARIKIIPKPGKKDYQEPKSYRPIGLLPVMGKVLEKAMTNRILWKLGREELLSPRQYGFLPQRSTEDALYDATEIIKNGLSKKQIVVVVSLDIEGAFDNAWWPAILDELRRKNLDKSLWNVLRNYLSDRTVEITYAGAKIVKETNKGCIQGSICGPLLWNILLDPLLQSMDSSPVHVQAFADDILLIATGKTGKEIDDKLNPTLEKIAQWGTYNKLRFAAHKTQALLITKKLKYEKPRLTLNNVEIEFSDRLKILGLTLDRNMNFLPHIEAVTSKAVNIYKALSRTARAHWGLNTSIRRIMYTAIIEPVLLYGSNIWGQNAHRKQIRSKLDKTTRLFTNLIAKSHRTTSLISSCILSRILPIDLRAQEQRDLYLIKRGKPLEELPGRPLECRMSPFALPHPANRKVLSFEFINEEEELQKIDAGAIQIFTDGSKIEGRVGGAITYWKQEVELGQAKFVLPKYCSVYQAELAAIYRATKLISAKAQFTRVAIISDSRAALQTLEDPNNTNPIANQIRMELSNLEEKGVEIKLFWVKAHINIKGNERADALAKEAALKLRTKPAYDAFPLSFAKRQIRIRTVEKWQIRYQEATTGGITKIFFPKVATANRILREIETDNCQAQIFTGHGGFRAYLYKKKLAESPYCTCDDETEETVIHVIEKCPKYHRSRYDCECKINMTIKEDNLHEIMENRNTRDAFMKFARKAVKAANAANGAKQA